MVLPEGFALPPVPYLVGLLAAVALVGAALARTDPLVSERTVLALAPWVLVGSSLHALFVLEWVPEVVRPLLGTPSVYLSTFVVAGVVWLAAIRTDADPERALGAVGTLVALAVVGYALGRGAEGGLRLFWPLFGLLVAVLLAGALWGATRWTRPSVTAATGAVGALALFGHALDAVSTAVGVDLLGFGERTPVSRAVLELAASLPTAETIGVGWLFVLVKLVIAEIVVVLFADFVREDPQQGFLLLGAVAAVGLGPGAHNLLLFVVTG
ncbi:DUF63 family protein [Halorussus sp. MSC15.2]|uniref:DUF63 family protein n=1 Tax=Halorussus sp. MSC15.2 TaxID=2283638 RepID=UPI0013CFE2F4|nr:DUF63 family protein [Halorussus sp. MSC15.2]NEU55762.1 DUF63 family protein [Halorussus sp. MSC15.2]